MNGFGFGNSGNSGPGAPRPGRTLRVSDVNNYIKSLLMYDANLTGICVTGEISNFKRYSSGHAYFSLKDPGGVLKCVMFANQFRKLDFMPADGMKVGAFGNIGVYERDGVYQLYVDNMRPDGVGALYEQFEKLKQKLAAEGLFDDTHKRPLPMLPKAVGVVTSPTGAVIRDIHNVISRRFPGMPIILYPASVQGAAAPGELISGLMKAQTENIVDVVIIGRGGGSIEDLWAFNDEKLARAVYGSALPVISAVGHETDFTICDFVADLRAPTPSAAAELAVPELDALTYTLGQYEERLTAAARNVGETRRRELERVKAGLSFNSLSGLLRVKRQLLSRNEGALRTLSESRVRMAQLKLDKLSGQLNAYSHRDVLKRGYALVRSDSGTLVKSAAELREQGGGTVEMFDGSVDVSVDK